MDKNIDALKNVYEALGGDLDDTYDDIANGAKVKDYYFNPDIINAIAKVIQASAEAKEPTEP